MSTIKKIRKSLQNAYKESKVIMIRIQFKHKTINIFQIQNVLTKVFKCIFITGLLHHIRDNFYLMSSRESFGRFTFESTPINNIMFPSIQQFLPDYGDQNNFQCLRAKLNLTSSKLDLLLTNCLEQHTIICRKVQLVKPECSKTSKSSSSLTLLLDPMLKLTFKRAIAYKTAEIKDMLQRLNLRDAYTSIFNVLWHTKEMCFGLKHFLLDPDSGGSQLRYCEWKGLPITCSAIFDTFPTDQGMCCTFNMKAADKIYIETTYRNMLEKRQDMDKSLSYQNIKLSQEYVDKGEPKTIAGQNKGLILLLDTHSNQAVPGSLDGDFSGFTAVIQSSDSFPLMSQEGLHIRPGFNNIITLTSSQVVSDHSMRDLKHNDRNCLFPEETGNLKIHKQYSYLNCKFECILFYAQEQVYNKYNTLCQPWFLPTSKDSIAICDPWQSYDFFQIMSKGIPDDFCSQCLPDCNVTTYKSKVVLMPFDTCDAKNFGVSKFCNLNLKTRFPMQEKVIAQIQNEFQSNKYGYFSYVTTDKDKSGDYFWKYSSSNRTYGWNIFKKVPYSYDAFDKDIAMVHIIFKKSTLVQMGSQRTMTWIDYFSQVGGILGLLLGMGFVSFIELIWLFARMFLEVMNGRLDDDLDE